MRGLLLSAAAKECLFKRSDDFKINRLRVYRTVHVTMVG